MKEEPFSAIDHVQLAMPSGEEEQARGFYCRVLGMTEIPKPLELAKRGGCWFASGDVQLHLGVEAAFRPAKKAHPAVLCRDYQTLTSHLRAAGIELTEDENIPGVRRCHVFDPFGNRVELIDG
jgi:catechol 2,3-dioxygenase-like lactoylglutathione lyase family enzyme